MVRHHEAAPPIIKCFYDKETNNCTYVAHCPETLKAMIIDSVLAYYPQTKTTSTASCKELIDYVYANKLIVQWIVETHCHADHLTAAPYLQLRFGRGHISIGEGIKNVQQHFNTNKFQFKDMKTDGSQFNHLFKDGDTFSLGNIKCEVIHTPGHTPDSCSYLIGDTVFVGDTLFMPDGGSARCDFPNGNAGQLYDSIQKLLKLPPTTRVYVNHDYQPNGRDVKWETTIQEESEKNIHIHGKTKEEFIKMRNERDATLNAPRLLWPSIQVNMNAGVFPHDETNHPYLLLDGSKVLVNENNNNGIITNASQIQEIDSFCKEVDYQYRTF